jgi:hypothetical protein
MTTKRSAWARRPRHPGPERIAARAGASRAIPRHTSTPQPVQMAELGALPNSVVTMTAVPDLLARQSSTSPFLLGATRPVVAPSHPHTVTVGSSP